MLFLRRAWPSPCPTAEGARVGLATATATALSHGVCVESSFSISEQRGEGGEPVSFSGNQLDYAEPVNVYKDSTAHACNGQ